MEAEIPNKARYILMTRYVRPQITGTFRALATIHSAKVAPIEEGSSSNLTNGQAYQSDE